MRLFKVVREGDGPKDMLEKGVLKGLARTWKEPETFLYAAAKGPKERWDVPYAPHTYAHMVAPREYERRVVDFLDRVVRAEEAATEQLHSAAGR